MLLEYFDRLDSTGKKTDTVITRDEAHRTGAWHGAFHCLIIYQQDGVATALFQRRSLKKKVAPGKLDVSVGGHYTSGEDARTAGPREIREELGLDIRFEQLVPVGRRVCVYGFTPGVREYEFQDVFLLPYPLNVQDLILQKEEVDGVFSLDIDSGIKLFSGKEPHVAGMFFRGEGSPAEPLRTSSSDFVSCLDNYYLKILLLARKYLSGERELLVI